MGELLDKAVIFATNMHSSQLRKGTHIPYILHPLESASIVGTMTDDDEIIAAAVLHDVIEDTETTIDEIIDKYIEMNIAHPFMEGNGRSTRIWLDLILKRTLKRCVDWSKIDKTAYMEAMRLSPTNPTIIRNLITNALTDKINDREMFMKGIDYSYYYEQND